MEERVQTYINGQTPIMAEALNAIQDAIIENSTSIATQATQISGKADASDLTAETTAREAADTALSDELDGVIEHIVEVSDTQPTSEYNKLWISETTPEGIVVPTWDEFEEVRDDVSDVKSALTAVTNSTYEYTNYQCTDIGTAYPQYSGGPSGNPGNAITISRNASYDSYVINIDRDTKIYIDATGISYYVLTVGNGGTGTWYSVGTNGAYKHNFSSAVRYRLSDNNLPSASDPLSVSAGTILVATVTATKSPMIYIQNATKTVKAKFGQIGCSVGDSEITLTGTNYKAIWRKTQTTQGYQWNLDDVIGRTKSILSANTDIVGVLRFDGQSNFMGGKHGNEDVVDFKVFADGIDVVDGESYEQVTVLMLSHLYDPDNTASNPVDRIVEMIFRPDGWTSRVTFLILTTATIDTSYPCGLYGFSASDANYCITNVGKLDLTSTVSQPIANKNLKQLTVNLTDNATITIVGEEFDATPFVAYRSNTDSFKVYWPKARFLSVSNGDVITGLCRYYI